MKRIKVKVLKGMKAKSSGLMGQEKAYPVFLKTRFGIHTYNLKFPIDILILDGKDEVVRLVENLKPNRLFMWPPIYYKVVELPAGEIEKLTIKLSDLIKLDIIN